MKKILISLVITSFILSSCDDDFEPGRTSQHMDKIGYSISMAQDDEFKSRGSSTNSQVSVRKLDANIGGKDLYLHTVVSNNIPQSVTALKNSTPISRGTITDSESIDEIAVSAIVINDSEAPKGWPVTGEAQMYMNNEPVYKDYNWTTGRYWPQEQDSIRFYAYSPVGALDDESQDYTKGLPNMSNNEPGFYYRVSDVVADQQDLLVAAAQYKGNYCKPAQINMCHALTAVELKLSDEIEGFTIKHLSISGVKNDGTYEYDFTPNLDECENSRDNGHWTLTDLDHQQGEYVLYEDEQGVELNGTQVSLGDNLVLLMMPQTLTDDATITVKGTDHITGLDITLTANIGDGPAWGKGQHVVYTLSFNPTRIEYIIEVKPTKELDANGRYFSPFHGESNINYTVRSFKRTTTPAEIIEEPLEWEIDESTLPAWIDHITLSGGDNATCTYSVLPNLTSSTSHNILKSNPQLGTEDAPWDLSRNAVYDGSSYPQNTANCYIVTAPGWYTLPLVYGNAITNGADNPASYLGDTEGTGETNGAGTPFGNNNDSKNYSRKAALADGTEVDIPIYTLNDFFGDNSKISKPWIVSNNNRGGTFEPGRYGVLWQDEPCLVTDVKLNAKGDYITFRVRSECINEGNALIYLRRPTGDKTILWSWHIWVTDQKDGLAGDFSNPTAMTNRMVTANYNAAATNASQLGETKENVFYLMQSNLGGCDADTKTYTEETFDVTFKLLEGGQEVAPSKDYVIRKDVLKVGVSGANIEMPYNAPYYQFGRKDPMLPGWYNGENKPFYKEDWTKGGYGVNVESDYGDFQVYGPPSNVECNHHMTLIHNPSAYFTGTNTTENKWPNLIYNLYTDNTRHIYINKWNAKGNKLPIFTFYNRDAASLYSIFKDLIDLGVTKTVYDPCPPGYEIPRVDAFSGTTFSSLNVNNWTTTDLVNVADIKPGLYGGNYEAIGFYTSPMPAKGVKEGNVFYIRALGHRNNQGIVEQYNNYGSAFTASPICAQWYGSDGELNPYFQFEAGRFCYTGSGWMRPFSSSDFDKAFPIIPAKTGCNPSTVIVDNDNNVYWSDGNETNFSGSFN